MSRLVLLNKPFQTLCQFRDKEGRPTLADCITLPGVYPAGRLDHDSEGLLLLTDDGALQARIADPRWKLPKTYWAQVEGEINDAALQQLRQGVLLSDGPARPVEAQVMATPSLWERHPPVRYRARIPTSWITLTLREGRNRQVRRMTAAVGFPTLRLIRVAIGPWHLEALQPGEYQVLELEGVVIQKLFGAVPTSSGDKPAKNSTHSDAKHSGANHFVTTASDPRPRYRSSSSPPKQPSRSPTPSSRKGRGS